MGRKPRTGVRAVSASSIEISFTYQGKRCREKIKLKPTPANLKRAERHRAAILDAAAAHDYLVTLEENAVAGGAGSGVNELLAAEGISVPVVNIGLGDEYIQHGTREECLRLAGLDADGILARIRQACGSEEARSKTAS